jgi:hypothetical protein
MIRAQPSSKSLVTVMAYVRMLSIVIDISAHILRCLSTSSCNPEN